MRSTLAGALGVLAVILLPVALVAAWVTDFSTDTDRFVRELRPIAANERVQAAITTHIVDTVQAELALPAPVAQQIERPLIDLVAPLVARPEVEQAWAAGLRSAHDGFVQVLEGDKPARVDASGRVVMPLTIPLTGVDRVLGRFGVAGVIDTTPEIPIALFSAEDLGTARTIYGVGSVAGPAAPWVVAALALLSVVLARWRARALGWLGIGSILAAVGLAAVLVLGRGAAGGVVTDPIASAVVDATYRLAEDGLMAQAQLALWIGAGLVGVAIVLGLAGVILRRRG